MRKLFLPTVAILALNACGPDETISGYADRKAVYHLVSLDNQPFVQRATIAFPKEGEAVGDGPCNSFSASQNTYYPWFELGPIASTRAACPDLEAETTYFDALGDMTFSEVAGTVLLLTGEGGREMTFEAR